MKHTADANKVETIVAPGIVDGWESERDTERAKVNARWFGIITLLGALLWIRAHSPTVQVSNGIVGSIACAAVLMTAGEAFYLWRPGCVTVPRWFKYGTVLGDMTFVSVLIFYTGFTQSPFFFVYFVFLISNCLRYGLLMSLFIALIFNVMYATVLGLAPPEARPASVLGGEGVKIVAFWAVALYGGSVSARLRRQANQLRVYEETLLQLRAQQGKSIPTAEAARGIEEAAPVPAESNAGETA